VATFEVDVLGRLELRIAGKHVPISGPKQRAILAMLALHANRAVSVSALIDAVWGDPAPDRADRTLQQHVSSIRKLLDTADSARALITQSPGYQLSVDHLDVDDFERATSSGYDAAEAGRWPDALAAFDTALACWRGPALADARDSPRLNALAVRLDEERLAAVEARFDARLEYGQARAALPELEQIVDEHPLRERLRGQLMLALYRCGRQADALAAYRSAREVLIEELGIEPGPALRSLEQSILMQSPELDGDDAASRREIHATFRIDERVSTGRIVLPDGQSVVLHEGVAVIGRDPSAQVHLVDSRVSRRHAQIDSANGRAVLRDLGSTNGTTVNGEPADNHVLADGDLVSIGGVELRFRGSEPDHRSPTRQDRGARREPRS
jgi:DNA-binding SARP family transcriptional activator